MSINRNCDTPTHNLKLMISLLLILAIVVVYGQVKNFDFVGYDDELYVTKNKHVQAGLTVEGFIWSFTTFHSANWHPITWLSHLLDYEVYGLNPMGHHWTNLQLHIANTLLLFIILQLMTGGLWKSGFVAALFALHPLHVESVAWISERKDVLSTFFGMLTILSYYRYVKKPRFIMYLMIILFLSMGLMAKPMLVTFPFVLLLLDIWPLRRFQFKNDRMLQSDGVTYSGFYGFLRLVLEKIPLFIPVVISSILTVLAQKSEGAIKTFGALPLKTRIANAVVSYVSYMSKAIWPRKLSVFYPYPGDTLSGWAIVGAALLIATVILLSIRTFKKYPYIAVGLFWYLGTLVPVIGILQVGDQAMADRYTYIPLIGLFIIVAWGVSDLFKKWYYRKIFLGLSAVIILSALTANTWLQLMHWKNGITLFEHAVKVTENNYVAQNNLGTSFGSIDLDKAIFHYKEALKIKPDYETPFFNLGIIMEMKGKIDEAIDYYLEALRINPNYLEAYNNLGTALFKKGDYEGAALYFAKAIKINPQKTDARNNIANVLFVQGKVDEAISQYKEILKANSKNADAHYNIAYVLSVQKKLDEAVSHYKQAIKINPEYVKAHYNLGNICLKQGNVKEAFSHFTEAIRISPDYADAYNKIGFILFKQGKLNKARIFFLKAVEVDPNYSEARNNLEILMRTIESNKP